MRNVSPLKLFLSFLLLGSHAFGGPAMVVYIKELATVRNRWLTSEEFEEGVALCQSLPGAISMDVAAYVGFKAGGTTGAFMAYLAFGLPAFVLITLLTVLYVHFHRMPQAVAIFTGLKIIIVAIVVNATASFKEGSVKEFRDALVVFSAAVLFWLGTNPFLVVLGGMVAGFVLYRDLRAGPGDGIRRRHSFKSLVHAGIILAIFCLGMIVLCFVDPRLMKLAAVMAKIDLFAFGGGFAALPLMLHQVVDVRGWLTDKTFMDGIALGQITPGPVIITASFTGYVLYGLKGAVVSTVAIFGPSFLLVLIAAPFVDRLKGSPLFARGVRGIIATFVGLLLFTAIKFALSIQWNVIAILFGLAAFTALLRRVHVLYVVVLGAVLSVLLFR